MLPLPNVTLTDKEYRAGQVPLLPKWRALLPALVALGEQPQPEQAAIAAGRLAEQGVFANLAGGWPDPIERGHHIRTTIQSTLEALGKQIPRGLPKGVSGYEFLLCWDVRINEYLGIGEVGRKIGDSNNGYLAYDWGDSQVTVRQRMWRNHPKPTAGAWPGVVCLIFEVEKALGVELLPADSAPCPAGVPEPSRPGHKKRVRTGSSKSPNGPIPTTPAEAEDRERFLAQFELYLRSVYSQSLGVPPQDVPSDLLHRGFDPLVERQVAEAKAELERTEELDALAYAYRAYRVNFRDSAVPSPLADLDEFAELAGYYGTTEQYADNLAPFLPVGRKRSHNKILRSVKQIVTDNYWLDFRVWWFKAWRANNSDAVVPMELRNHPDFAHEFQASGPADDEYLDY